MNPGFNNRDMIDFNYLTKFELADKQKVMSWLEFVLDEEDRELGEVSYIFCDDEYLYDINVKHLNHKTLTCLLYTSDAADD